MNAPYIRFVVARALLVSGASNFSFSYIMYNMWSLYTRNVEYPHYINTCLWLHNKYCEFNICKHKSKCLLCTEKTPHEVLVRNKYLLTNQMLKESFLLKTVLTVHLYIINLLRSTKFYLPFARYKIIQKSSRIKDILSTVFVKYHLV